MPSSAKGAPQKPIKVQVIQVSEQICGNLNPKDVTDSFEYNCPECFQILTMHSLEFDVIDVHSCNIIINFSNSCMYKFYSFLIVATFKLERIASL